MSVQTQASYARANAVGKAEQMVRNAGGTLGGFPVAQRVGAGRESLVLVERLLVAALEQIRTVQEDLELAQADEPDEPTAPAPAPAPSGPTPLSVRKAASGLDVVR